eukprot:CAMPEP_0201687928 /NCGR_PEP_ID=MMETSP0578-20130828/1760_1 /ASSEMBLY_ACC=CAM_ASM_000663 /TAXON_ID=267565 /ORGANISM="Skeletonema grethea, Strain CCMP 1804" /LENGTH=303 /DNA_ID=CAMNT_0048172109 /DNA_START=10 /DNA_END=921 /DNA_ORIENTATION=-
MAKLSILAAALCALAISGPVSNAFSVGRLQTRLEAKSMAHYSTASQITPFESSSDDNTNMIMSQPAVRSSKKTTTHMKSIAKAALSFVVIASTITSVATPAYAKAAKATEEVVEHLHTGQKIANYFRSFGIPDLAILAIISAMPVVELRGAVPVGVWMGLPITKVLPVCVLGNMTPIIPLLFLLRNDKLKKLMSPILARAEKKSSSLGVGSIEKQWASLAAFVGIPLPGTGAWTGAMGAFLLGMPTAVALSSIFTGVVSAGAIMTAITLAGKKGGIGALAALALITGREFLAGKEEDGAEAEE